MKEILEGLLKKEKGIEVWIEIEDGIELEKRDRKLFLKENYSDQSLTIRYVNKEGKGGLSYTTSLETEAIEEAYLKAKVLSSYGVPVCLPEPSQNYPGLSTQPFRKLTSEKILTFLEELEELAFNFDPAIKRVEKIKFAFGMNKYLLYRESLELTWETPFYSFVISVVAKSDKKEASAYEWFEGAVLDWETIEERTLLACKKAIALSRAEKTKSFKTPVLFPPFIAVELLDLLEFSFSGDEVLKGRSRLKDKIEKKIFSKKINLLDDGLREDLPESRPFDDEGVPQAKTILVENGILKNFLWDTYWGKKAGVSSTGNARRPDFSSFPKISTTNFYLEKGELKREELLKRFSQVFEVVEILGAHTADPISGEFSFGASGILYSQGEPVAYLSEMALSGNLFEVFERVVELGSDLTFYGSTGSPSILVEELEIG